MTCYITGSAEGDARLSADEANKEATHTTALLCEVIDSMTPAQRNGLSGMAKAWWDNHKVVVAEARMRRPSGLNADTLWIMLGRFASDMYDEHYADLGEAPFPEHVREAGRQWRGYGLGK